MPGQLLGVGLCELIIADLSPGAQFREQGWLMDGAFFYCVVSAQIPGACVKMIFQANVKA